MGTYDYEVVYGMLFCMLWIETLALLNTNG